MFNPENLFQRISSGFYYELPNKDEVMNRLVRNDNGEWKINSEARYYEWFASAWHKLGFMYYCRRRALEVESERTSWTNFYILSSVLMCKGCLDALSLILRRLANVQGVADSQTDLCEAHFRTRLSEAGISLAIVNEKASWLERVRNLRTSAIHKQSIPSPFRRNDQTYVVTEDVFWLDLFARGERGELYPWILDKCKPIDEFFIEYLNNTREMFEWVITVFLGKIDPHTIEWKRISQVTF
jgi:hypothetical protein